MKSASKRTRKTPAYAARWNKAEACIFLMCLLVFICAHSVIPSPYLYRRNFQVRDLEVRRLVL